MGGPPLPPGLPTLPALVFPGHPSAPLPTPAQRGASPPVSTAGIRELQRLSRYRNPMHHFWVSSHPGFPWTLSGMGNSLPHKLFCSSQANCPAVEEWEQPTLTLRVCLWRWIKKKCGFFLRCQTGQRCVHSQPRILPASYCLPFPMTVCDLTHGGGLVMAYGSCLVNVSSSALTQMAGHFP